MKFIHTSDWQIGRTFRFADDDTLGALQAERLEVIRRLGHLARQEGVIHVLVAGDVYEHEAPAERTLHQPIERMREFPDLQWHLIPGNHDADQPEGVWARLLRSGLPANVQIHREPGPVLIDPAQNGWLLPAVLKRRHVLTDLTAYMDEAETPPDALRIGLAHGSVVGFGGRVRRSITPWRWTAPGGPGSPIWHLVTGMDFARLMPGPSIPARRRQTDLQPVAGAAVRLWSSRCAGRGPSRKSPATEPGAISGKSWRMWC
ncbi:metallophosphoesterase family protein [Acetobacter persici]|uniref:metallophosphoesterase family protein n=1 Tax=Acetobacter persici TaxID=1076596 RepID=UPI001FCA9DC8|nr:metallophosphoesterase [Acetobacter persici]